MFPRSQQSLFLGAGFWLAATTACLAGQATILVTNGSSNSRDFISHTCSSTSAGFMKDPLAVDDVDAGVCAHNWPIPQAVFGTAKYENCTIHYNTASEFYNVSGDCTLDDSSSGAGSAFLFVTLTD